MNSEYTTNMIAQLVTIGLTRARMLTTYDLESVIMEVSEALNGMSVIPPELDAISQVETLRGIALLLVGRLTANRRIDTFRHTQPERYQARVAQAVRVVEIELHNAKD